MKLCYTPHVCFPGGKRQIKAALSCLERRVYRREGKQPAEAESGPEGVAGRVIRRGLCFPLFSFCPESRRSVRRRAAEEPLKGGGMAKAELTALIAPKCQGIADRMGFELVEVALDKEPTGKYLRIYIDKPEGITLDDCEAFHRAALPLVENYEYDFMEVSSPGIDRPLKTDRDYERNLGAKISVRLYRAVDGVKELEGILSGFDGESLKLETPEGERTISRKAAASVKPVVDMEGIEEVEFEESEKTDA